MKDVMENDPIALHFLRSGFCDLAVAFARIDPAAADQAIDAIMRRTADRLTDFREEAAKRIGIERAHGELAGTARILRETMLGAKAQIAQAAKPN